MYCWLKKAMAPEDIRFESIKEDRGWYFVEYSPPIPNYPFSMLSLTVVKQRDIEAVAVAMESETRSWLRRFPFPVMTSAFGLDESLIPLSPIRPIDHLMAWIDPKTSKPVLRWELVANEELPDIAHDRAFIRKVFATIPYKTGAEIRDAAMKSIASRKMGQRLIFIWAVVVPLGVAVLEWWSDLLGLVVLGYAFCKAGFQALRLGGHLPKSARQLAKDKEELEMRHHHYHCKRNPEAFARLKVENFQREAIERTKEEAAILKKAAEKKSSKK